MSRPKNSELLFDPIEAHPHEEKEKTDHRGHATEKPENFEPYGEVRELPRRAMVVMTEDYSV